MAQLHDDGEYHHTISDVSKRANTLIWVNFFGFGLFLFVTIWLLIIYFDSSVQKERFAKIESKTPKELLIKSRYDMQVLEGKKSVEAGKPSISMQEAMQRYVDDIRQGNNG